MPRRPFFTAKTAVRAAERVPTQCSVCLEPLEAEEMCRVLPRCEHLYHAKCIDAWFARSTQCPCCKDDVLSTAPRARPSVDSSVESAEG